jgi:hypothetical protein
VWAALDGRCLLRDELAEEVVKRVGAALRKRLRSGFAFLLDELRQGPPQGSRITLVRPDQWIDGWRRIDDEEEALRDVCRCFLRDGPCAARRLQQVVLFDRVQARGGAGVTKVPPGRTSSSSTGSRPGSGSAGRAANGSSYGFASRDGSERIAAPSSSAKQSVFGGFLCLEPLLSVD